MLFPMQLAKDACACAAAEAPTAFQVGVIHSIHELTMVVVKLVQEVQKTKGA